MNEQTRPGEALRKGGTEMEGRWDGGRYCPPEDLRGAFIRARMRERYPRIEDEFAIMAYGTAEERAAHAAWRAEVKAEADRKFPKSGD